ncbi:MAG: hypothetical protein K2X72_27160 [Reyranella sp.]|nr:hypothetical protein [Reyranella sp.]
MAGLFDDLVAGAPAAEPASAKPKRAGLFDDLLEAPAPSVAGSEAKATVPAGDGAAAVGRGIIDGVPVVGPYILGGLNRAAAAVRTLQNGTTFPEELKNVEAFGEATAKENPKANFGGELAGGIVGTLPLVAVAPAAFGVGSGSLVARTGASTLSGGVLGGADSAVRSNGDASSTGLGAAIGAGLGALGPGIGHVAGKVVRALTSPGRSQALVTEALDGISDKDLASAQFLIEQAKSLPGGGVNLTLDEALNAVTGGQATRASQLARVVANSGGEGGRVMGEFYAGRPASIDNVGRAAVDRIAPQNPSPTGVGFDLQEAARAGVAQTPEGMALTQAQAAAGPRVTADQAGRVIQPELRAVADAAETTRSTQAARDYAAAREAPENVGIERTVTVERSGEPIVTPATPSRPQFEPGAPRPVDGLNPNAPADAGPGPESLARYIARKGGIRLDGDARANDLQRYNVPGLGNVARRDGKGIDDFWREELIGAGYLKPDMDGSAARDIRDELLRKLINEQRGVPSYPIGAEPTGAKVRVSLQADEFRNATQLVEGTLDRDLINAGIRPESIHPDIRSRVVGEMMRDPRADALDTLEKVVMAQRDPPAPFVKSTTVREEIPDVRFGQVNPQAALDAIDGQLRTAKGDVRSALSQARKDLFGTDGQTDLSVEGLLHARERLDQAIAAAREAADGTKVRDLQIARSALDGELKAVPEVATADTNFAANSRPLEPFTGNTPLARVVRQDPLTGRMATPAEEVASTLQGATATREFLTNATPAAREAYEGRLSTRLLDGATDARGNVSAESLLTALRENADVLDLVPAVRTRLQEIARARDGLARVEASPLGRIAERPAVKAAVDALFPANPTPGSQAEIAGAVEALARNNPRAARDVVRIYMEGVFNEATQDLKGLPRQYGGAGFASAVRGNGQQRQNLEAAVRALPNGETIWTGLDRMLSVFEATGYKPVKGSDTYFNSVIGQRLKEGSGPVGKAITEVVASAAAGAGVGGAKGAAGGAVLGAKRAGKDLLQERRMLKDGEAIARILTDPKAIPLLRSLSSAPAGSRSAEVLTTKLILLANRGGSSAIDRK